MESSAQQEIIAVLEFHTDEAWPDVIKYLIPAGLIMLCHMQQEGGQHAILEDNSDCLKKSFSTICTTDNSHFSVFHRYSDNRGR